MFPNILMTSPGCKRVSAVIFIPFNTTSFDSITARIAYKLNLFKSIIYFIRKLTCPSISVSILKCIGFKQVLLPGKRIEVNLEEPTVYVLFLNNGHNCLVVLFSL